jgi:hypothetical protein
MPADDPSGPGMSLIVAKQPSAGSLIVNGGFDGGLAPWICEGGRVIQDPADEKNWLLEATPTEGRFRLVQIFKPPSRKADITLSFRAMISEDASPSGFDLMLLGHNEQLLTQTIVEEGSPGEWKRVEWKGSTAVAPAALYIGRRGKGVVWIDDVRLEQSPAEPAQAQAP